MACHLLGAKPLSEPMLVCSTGTLGNSNQNSNIFIQVNAIDYVIWKMAAIVSPPQYVNP